MAGDTGIPRIARFLLERLVPSELREDIVGDVAERHARLTDTVGRRAADRWVWRQVMALRPLAMRAELRRAGRRGVRRRRGAAGTGRGSEWAQDVWLGYRALRARPVTSLTVILTVAVAVGVTTSVFGVVGGVLLTPLPYPEPDRLVLVWQTNRAWMESANSQLRRFADRFPLSVPTLADWSAEETGLEALGGYADRTFVSRTREGADVIDGQAAMSGMFAALGIDPQLGRPLVASDDVRGAARVAVLSHGFWQERYGGDPDVPGRDIDLDGVAHTIVGVMPPGFRPPTGDAHLWAPLTEEEKADVRDSQFLYAVARLSPGVTREEASRRLALVQQRLAEAYPEVQGDLGSRIEGLLEAVVGDVRSTLWLLFGAVVLVLVIAGLNIAGLLSVTGLARRRELAVKAALGAGSARLARGLMLESAALAGLGGLAGVLLARVTLPLLVLMIPPTLPRHENIVIDGGVLSFGLAVTALTAVLIGALPALRAKATQPQETLRSAARGLTADRSATRVRSALVTGEVALAFVLLVGAGLLGTSFVRLWSVDRGFATDGIIAMTVEPDPLEHPERADRDRFIRELHRRLSAIPGAAVTAANQVPLAGSLSSTRYAVERPGSEPEETNVLISAVLDNWFEVMGIPVIRGRPLGADDDREAPLVGVVNESMAGRVWPGESPIGKRLRARADSSWLTVVGVARNVRHQGLAVDVEPKLYVTAWQAERTPRHWVLRARGDVPAVLALARQAVTDVSPSTPVRDVQVLEERIATSVAVPRFRALFVAGLAALAAGLALLGVFSVVALTVTQRTREIGVRMALGAKDRAVVRGVVSTGARLAGTGIALGLAIAIPAAAGVRGFLFQVEPVDPLIYLATAVGLLLVACLACWAPARRAAAVDPVTVLNGE